MKANNFTSAGHNRINSIFYQIFHRNSYDRFTILLLTFFIFYGIIRLLRGGSPSPVQLSTVIRSRLIQALWLCLVALIELLCWTHWSIRVKILRLLPRSLFSLPRRSRLLHFFAHVITNILPAASYLQAFCFCHLSESAPYISATFLPPENKYFCFTFVHPILYLYSCLIALCFFGYCLLNGNFAVLNFDSHFLPAFGAMYLYR